MVQGREWVAQVRVWFVELFVGSSCVVVSLFFCVVFSRSPVGCQVLFRSARRGVFGVRRFQPGAVFPFADAVSVRFSVAVAFCARPFGQRS